VWIFLYLGTCQITGSSGDKFDSIDFVSHRLAPPRSKRLRGFYLLASEAACAAAAALAFSTLTMEECGVVESIK